MNCSRVSLTCLSGLKSQRLESALFWLPSVPNCVISWDDEMPKTNLMTQCHFCLQAWDGLLLALWTIVKLRSYQDISEQDLLFKYTVCSRINSELVFVDLKVKWSDCVTFGYFSDRNKCSSSRRSYFKLSQVFWETLYKQPALGLSVCPGLALCSSVHSNIFP